MCWRRWDKLLDLPKKDKGNVNLKRQSRFSLQPPVRGPRNMPVTENNNGKLGLSNSRLKRALIDIQQKLTKADIH